MSKSTENESRRMRFTDSWAIRGGLLLLVLGTGPLFAIMLAANLGRADGPNPNPNWPGLLAGFTFLPSVILIIAGVTKVKATRQLP
jgi:hypothetical protein